MKIDGVSKVLKRNVSEQVSSAYNRADSIRRCMAFNHPCLRKTRILITTQRAGFCKSSRSGESLISIPLWTFRDASFFRRYLIHEFCHAIEFHEMKRRNSVHSREFYFTLFRLWDELDIDAKTRVQWLMYEVSYKSRAAAYNREYQIMKELLKEAKS